MSRIRYLVKAYGEFVSLRWQDLYANRIPMWRKNETKKKKDGLVGGVSAGAGTDACTGRKNGGIGKGMTGAGSFVRRDAGELKFKRDEFNMIA